MAQANRAEISSKCFQHQLKISEFVISNLRDLFLTCLNWLFTVATALVCAFTGKMIGCPYEAHIRHNKPIQTHARTDVLLQEISFEKSSFIVAEPFP